VVVAGRAAGREGVAQPEAVALRNRVGEVGEGGRSLVGGDHQIGVVIVPAHHLLRRHQLARHQIVGDVEHAGDEEPIAGDPFLHEGVAVARRRRLLEHEPALRADRHDDRVLHLLRFHQAQHLGAEILAPVGPAKPAAGDQPEAQMHRLETRAVDEDLAQGGGLRNLVDLAAGQLDGDHRLVAAILGRLEEVGAQRRQDDVEEAPDDPVLVEVADFVQRLVHGLDQLVPACLPVAVELRVEAHPEQLRDMLGDRAVERQRLLHIVLAEGDRGLAQILRIGAQHHHVAPAEPGAQHQAVEAVILDLAFPHAHETVVEDVAHRVEIDRLAAMGLEREIVQMDDLLRALGLRALAAIHRVLLRADLVGLLLHHLEAHILEHRHDGGEHHRPARVIDLEAELVLLGLDRMVEADAELPGLQRHLDAVDVEGGGLDVEMVAIGDREGFGIFAQQGEAALLPVVLDHRLAQAILPGARFLAQLGLELLAVVGRDLTGRRLDDELDAAQRLVGHVGVVGDDRPFQLLRQDAADLAAQIGREPVARDVDQRRDIALERVRAQEQRDALALLQMQDALGDIVELVALDLEQLVARIALQDMGQRLGRMPAGLEAGALDHRLDLLPQQRDLPRALVVGDRGQEPDEQPFADRLAVLVEDLDRHRVHMHPPVHGRAPVRLGDAHQVRLEHGLLDLDRQAAEMAQPLEHLAVRIAQHAEAALVVDHQLGVLAGALEADLAIAHEGEMVVMQPLHEGGRLLDGALVDALGRGLLQRLHHLGGALAHRLPVLDRRAHVAEHLGQPLLDRLQHRRGRLLVDLDMHEALARQLGGIRAFGGEVLGLALGVALDAVDRVDDQMDGQPLARQLHGHAVDQEGHVVVDDLDHRVGRVPAMLLEAGIVDADLGRARGALLPEGPHRERRAVEILRLAVDDILRRGVAIVMLGEEPGPARLVAGHPLVDQIEDLVQQLGLALVDGLAHRVRSPRHVPGPHSGPFFGLRRSASLAKTVTRNRRGAKGPWRRGTRPVRRAVQPAAPSRRRRTSAAAGA
jgi:hypothetical protein